MSKEYFLRKLQKIAGQFPRGLDNIIFESGYDSESAIASINSSSIKSIEDYINENKEILKNSVYEHLVENDLPFKLKPGHKSIILTLPKSLQEYKVKQKSKIEAALPIPPKEDELKKSLVAKLIKFAKKFSYEIEFSESSIHDFCDANTNLTCVVACPFCETRIKCTHKSYWLVSNFEKHLKRHFERDIQIETVTIEPVDITTPNENSEELLNYSADQLDDLNAILDEEN